MWKNSLCLGLMGAVGQERLEPEDEIRLLCEAGFEGFFSGWNGGDSLARCKAAAKREGMGYLSVHAPFGKARDMWHGSPEAAQAAQDELVRCLEDCAEAEVPVRVAHVCIGFEDHSPSARGLSRCEAVVRRAEDLGVKVAFENTEGLEYLDAVMEMAKAYPDAAGFCWDTGHEMCYNRFLDMPGRYPGTLVATHINDNLGVRDFGGEITWTDDLHLLPFDGICDWGGVAERLRDFRGPLTFELTTQSKPGRHDNDKYARMSAADFLAEAYARACRVAALVQRTRES